MKFVHAADIHLDSPLRGLERYDGAPVDEVRGATRRAFENLVDLAVEEQAAFVLLAGDLYDGDWKDYNTGLFFTRQMGRLQEAGIEVLAVAGNHDAASQLTKTLRPPGNVHFFSTRLPETRVLEPLGVAVHGQGFASRAVTDDLALAYPHPVSDLFNIGLLHTSLDGRAGHEPYAPCTIDRLRSKGYRYWALGHVHQREEVSREPWVVFPGNLQGRHVRETGSKGCTLVTVEDGRVTEVQHWPLDVMRWVVCAVDLAGAATLDEVYDRVGRALSAHSDRSEGRTLAVRLRLVGACSVHGRLRSSREQLVNECRALAITAGAGTLWLETLVIDTRPAESQAAALARDDAFGGLLRSIRDWELEPDRLSALSEEFLDLAAKLPADCRAGPESCDPTDPGILREALEDVRESLLERLLSRGSPE